MNNQIPKTEQWKLSGNCDKCRRANYCNKPCGAKKVRTKGLYRALGNAIIDYIAPTPEITDGAKKWL